MSSQSKKIAFGHKKKIKILWLSYGTEIEYEMKLLFSQYKDIKFNLGIPNEKPTYFFPGYIKANYNNLYNRENIQRVLEDYQPDILIHRYQQPYEPILEAAEDCGVRTVCWITEQGPERDIELLRAKNFRNVIVNNELDYELYKKEGIENLYYMPFCYVPSFHKRVLPSEKYKTDIVCYGNPAYEFYESKRKSVDTLVVPLLKEGYDVALWGPSEVAGGWLKVPYVKKDEHYKGMFNYKELPVVNSSAKIVLGITANASYGAYGGRLARALGCGSFVLWYYTEGMEKYFVNHKHLCWSKSPEETLEIVSYYLNHDEEREKIALEGQRFAYENLNYEKRFIEIINDLLTQPSISKSKRYKESKIIIDEYNAGNYKGVISLGERLFGLYPEYTKDEVCFYIGNAYYYQGNYDKARYFWKAFPYSQIRPEFLHNLALAYYKLGEMSQAREFLNQILQIKPDYLDAQWNLKFMELNPNQKINLKLTDRLMRKIGSVRTFFPSA